jgi:hypothetical protein
MGMGLGKMEMQHKGRKKMLILRRSWRSSRRMERVMGMVTRRERMDRREGRRCMRDMEDRVRMEEKGRSIWISG